MQSISFRIIDKLKNLSSSRSIFWSSLSLYLALWVINPQNKIIALSFILFTFLVNYKIKNVRLSILLSYIASLIIATGKTYTIQLIPPGIFPIDRWPSGYIYFLTISPKHILAALMFLIAVRDFVSGKFSRIKITSLDWLVFLYFFWGIISDLFASNRPEVSILSAVTTFDRFMLYGYLRLYLQRWKKIISLILSLFIAMILFESVISMQQFIASSPIGKNIEAQVGIEYFGEAVDELAFRFRPVGTFEHANELGQILSFLLLVVIAQEYLRPSIGHLGIVFMGIITLIMTLSRSAWIAFILGLLILLYIIEKRLRISQLKVPGLLILTSSGIFIILLSFFILPRMERSLYSFGQTSGGGYVRNLQIENALTLIFLHPFFGVGSLMSVPEGLIVDPSGILTSFPSPVHNWYFFTAIEHGLPALFLFLFFVILLLRRIYHTVIEIVRNTVHHVLLIGFFVGILALLVTGIFQPFISDIFIFLSLGIIQSMYQNRSYEKII